MPKKNDCYSEFCAGREFDGLGFNNRNIQGEFIHNQDYVKTPDQKLADYAECGMIQPGAKRRPITGFD